MAYFCNPVGKTSRFSSCRRPWKGESTGFSIALVNYTTIPKRGNVKGCFVKSLLCWSSAVKYSFLGHWRYNLNCAIFFSQCLNLETAIFPYVLSWSLWSAKSDLSVRISIVIFTWMAKKDSRERQVYLYYFHQLTSRRDVTVAPYLNKLYSPDI